MQLELTKSKALILMNALKHCVEYYDSISEDRSNNKSTIENAIIYADNCENILHDIQSLIKSNAQKG